MGARHDFGFERDSFVGARVLTTDETHSETVHEQADAESWVDLVSVESDDLSPEGTTGAKMRDGCKR